MAEQTVTGVRERLARLPRLLVRQLVLLVPVVVDLLVMVASGRIGDAGPYYAAGLTLVVAVTAVTALSAAPLRATLPALLVTALPMLDLAAIGLMRLVPDGNGIAVLSVLPAMWLASDHRMRGVAWTLLGVLLLVSVPSLLYFGAEPAVWSRGLTIPTIAVMCAVTVAGTTDVWRQQNRELELQGDRLQQALEEVTVNRALTDAIVSTVDVGLLALDREGRYTHTNPRMRQFLGLAYPEGHRGLAGQPGELYAADGRTRLDPAEAPSVRALSGERFADLVLWMGSPDGEQRAVSVSATPIRDAAGRLDGAVLAYHDITEIMAALRMKDEFVASVSHELRTPLTSILGFLEMAVDDPSVTAEVRRRLEVVTRNAERLLRLVGDLLLSAQVDSGRLLLETEAVDLRDLVGAAVLDQQPRAARRGVLLGAELDGELVVQADPVRLGQVVENLVSNAVKYTPEGGSVTVRLAVEDGVAVLAVADTGMGIAPDDLPRLFTRFFRTREAERRAIEGLGLGLAITRSIVEAHGGRIDVSSRLGEGSTFRVSLPFQAPVVPAAAVVGGTTLAGHGERRAPAGPSAAGAGAAVRRLPPP